MEQAFPPMSKVYNTSPFFHVPFHVHPSLIADHVMEKGI